MLCSSLIWTWISQFTLQPGTMFGTVTMFAPGWHKLLKIYQKRKKKKREEKNRLLLHYLYIIKWTYFLNYTSVLWLLSVLQCHWQAWLGCQLSLPLQSYLPHSMQAFLHNECFCLPPHFQHFFWPHSPVAFGWPRLIWLLAVDNSAAACFCFQFVKLRISPESL